MSARDDFDDLTGAYALDALDAADRAAFESRLADSESLRTEAGEFADTALVLGLAVRPEQPPTGLRDSLMAEIARTPQLAPQPPTAVPGAAERRSQARWFRESLAPMLAAAAAVVLVLGGLAANVATQTVVAQQQAAQLAALDAAPDTQRLAAEVATGGTATLVWSEQLASSALLVDGLDELPADRVYALWYIDESGARPAGTFRVTGDGQTSRVLNGEMDADDSVGVTVEPVGPLDSPTTAPIVVLGA